MSAQQNGVLRFQPQNSIMAPDLLHKRPQLEQGHGGSSTNRAHYHTRHDIVVYRFIENGGEKSQMQLHSLVRNEAPVDKSLYEERSTDLPLSHGFDDGNLHFK